MNEKPNRLLSSLPKALLILLLGAYLLFLLDVTLFRYFGEHGVFSRADFPTAFADRRLSVNRWNLSLTPLSYHTLRYWGTALGLESSINYGTAAANAFFSLFRLAPVAFLLPLLYPGKKMGWIMLRCLVVSFALEGLQFVTMLGVFDIDHILFNMLGCLFGYGIYTLAVRLARKGKEHFAKRRGDRPVEAPAQA